jgi:putative dehydrogenase
MTGKDTTMTVGIIGLGIMGSAYSNNLLKAGVAVAGVDTSTEARNRLDQAGGTSYDVIGPWMSECDLIIISVASPVVLAAVSASLGAVLSTGQVVMETGTFSMNDKFGAQAEIERNGAILLDTPVSGTGAQAARADLVIMASGPKDAIKHAKKYMQHLSHTVIEAGDFGAGSKLKYVANHIVALHNCAAAETLHYADSLGLDRKVVYNLLSKGAGQSRMLDLRMPLMVSGEYTPATAHMAMFEKDLSIIGSDIEAQGITTPMFDAVTALYDKAWSLVPQDYDTAAIFEVYRHIDNS